MVRQDFKEIYKSLSKLSINYLKKFEKELEQKILLLKENPYLYQCFNIEKENRRFVIQKYILFYKIKNHNVIILRILSQKLDYNQKEIYQIKSTK